MENKIKSEDMYEKGGFSESNKALGIFGFGAGLSCLAIISIGQIPTFFSGLLFFTTKYLKRNGPLSVVSNVFDDGRTFREEPSFRSRDVSELKDTAIVLQTRTPMFVKYPIGGIESKCHVRLPRSDVNQIINNLHACVAIIYHRHQLGVCMYFRNINTAVF